MIDRKVFFSLVRNKFFNGKLTQRQVDGMNVILDEWEKLGYTDLRWLAYILATTYHETAATMWPVEEYGKGKGRVYGTWYKNSKGEIYSYKNGSKKTIYLKSQYDHLYYGRGFVQLTWWDNYNVIGKILGIDLVNNPQLVLEPEISAQILIEGMVNGKSSRGDFTGVSLETYFNKNKEDWINARKIINGLDKASLIAGYGKTFYSIVKQI